ncbi:MAG: polyphosphate kinase 1 [Pirellulaceae bacterium]
MSQTDLQLLNRELSWLEFNQRVLDQARHPEVPLLERLKFLAITGSNLDEFFMVRVGGLQLQENERVGPSDPSGPSPTQQLEAIHRRVVSMVESQYRCLSEDLEPALQREGMERVRWEGISTRQLEAIERIFQEEIFPVLSPMAIEPENPFPLLQNLGLYLVVRLEDGTLDPPHRFAMIPLGKSTPRFITLPSDSKYSYVLLEDLVGHCVDRFFPGMTVLEWSVCRITRNLDISLRDDGAADLMSGMEQVLLQRRVADSIRLEISQQASEVTTHFLAQSLGLGQREVFRIPGPIDLSSMLSLTETDGFPSLRDPAWLPQPSPNIDPAEKMFDNISRQDLLLCHPYESYEPVVRLIEEASLDPDVLAIKQILYRTGRRSAIVAALKRAAERGKYVTVIVELKARFDEARNIEWAKELEQAGVQVIYGVRGLKTHAKVCIVVRREPHGIQRYVHFGTGNYNESTARLYSDISYLTCRDEWGADASSFFNAITGFSQPQSYRQIDAAPIGLRKKLIALIDGETSRRKQGQRAHITAKLNALVDPEMIAALYRASKAGVNVRLNVRGVCCLRPGVAGLSENIQVVSIVDRFLEHARILHFHHGGDDLAFISSADWMPRNLDRRVELLVPIEDAPCRRKLLSILDAYFRDNQNSWLLQADGSYRRKAPQDEQSPVRSQRWLYEMAVGAVEQMEHDQRTLFQPHIGSRAKRLEG